MPTNLPSQSYKTDAFSATLYELATNVFFLVVKGEATTMTDVDETNNLLKVKLNNPELKPEDIHFIIDSTDLVAIPSDPDTLQKVLRKMSYLGNGKAGYLITLLQHRNFVVEAFLELASKLSGPLLRIKPATVFSPKAAVEFLEKNLSPDNRLWQQTTPQELLNKITSITPTLD